MPSSSGRSSTSSRPVRWHRCGQGHGADHGDDPVAEGVAVARGWRRRRTEPPTGRRGRAYSSAGVACWMMRPSYMTATSSPRTNASSWSWVTKTVVIPRSDSSRWTSPRTCTRRAVSRLEKGSSSRMHRRLRGDGPGQGDPLLLAAGQRRGVAFAEPAHSDQGESLVDPGLALGFAGQPVADVGRHREVGKQRPVLEDHADPAAFGRDEHVAGHLGDRGPADGDPAGVGPLEAGDDPQQGGLAAAARVRGGRGPVPARPRWRRRRGPRPDRSASRPR